MKQIISISLFALLLGVLSGCGSTKHPSGDHPDSSKTGADSQKSVTGESSASTTSSIAADKSKDKTLRALGDSSEQLVNRFNSFKKKKRLLMVLSPT